MAAMVADFTSRVAARAGYEPFTAPEGWHCHRLRRRPLGSTSISLVFGGGGIVCLADAKVPSSQCCATTGIHPASSTSWFLSSDSSPFYFIFCQSTAALHTTQRPGPYPTTQLRPSTSWRPHRPPSPPPATNHPSGGISIRSRLPESNLLFHCATHRPALDPRATHPIGWRLTSRATPPISQRLTSWVTPPIGHRISRASLSRLFSLSLRRALPFFLGVPYLDRTGYHWLEAAL